MKFQINPNLDIDSLKKTFQQNKKVVISNFLTEESADILYNFFAKDMPEDWWKASYMNHNRSASDGYDDDNVSMTPRSTENYPLIKQKLIESQKAFLNGNFSYFFDRTTTDHVDGCTCIECQYREFLEKESTLKWFSNLIDDEISSVGEFFASRFLPNHFLSPHHDHEKGKIATVLNLSKNWKPEWGGCLHFMDSDYKTVTRHVQPSFNKLSLFDIPSSNGIPHYVSHVVPGCKLGRISYTGWYH